MLAPATVAVGANIRQTVLKALSIVCLVFACVSRVMAVSVIAPSKVEQGLDSQLSMQMLFAAGCMTTRDLFNFEMSLFRVLSLLQF